MEMELRVTLPLCPLSAAPEDGAERVDELLCGMAATVLEPLAGGWLRLRTFYGYEGYAPAPCLAPASEWEKQPLYVVLLPPFLDVLQEPEVEAPVLATLPRGSLVAVPEGNGGRTWLRLLLPDGREGFAPGEGLAPFCAAPRYEEETALRQAVVSSALRYLGTPYRWGGKTPTGIDCSGLTSTAYLLHGVTIFRDARMEPGYPVRPISREELKPADLLYWPGHTALYLGDGRYLHATARAGSRGVVINSLDPQSASYRPDLAEPFPTCGSIF